MSEDVSKLDLNWDDPEPYLWRFEPWKDSDLSGEIAGALIFPGCLVFIIFAVLWIFGYFLPVLATWSTVAFLGLLAIGVATEEVQCVQIKEKSKDGLALFYLAGATLLFFLMQNSGSFINTGFQHKADFEPALSTWLLFFVENILQVVMLDGAEIFGLSLTKLSASTWLSQTVVLIFRLLIGIGLIKMFILLWRQYCTEMEFFGSVKAMYWRCSATPYMEKLNVRRLIMNRGEAFETMVGTFVFSYLRWKLGFAKEKDLELIQKFESFKTGKPLFWALHRNGNVPYFSISYLLFFIILLPILTWITCFFGYNFISPELGFNVAYLIIVAATLFLFTSISTSFCGFTTFSKILHYFRCWIGIAALGALVFLIVTPGNFCHAGFATSNVTTSSEWWCLIGDNILRTVLFDAPEIYQINLSSIRLDSFSSRMVIFLFRLFLTIALIELVLDIWKLLFNTDYLTATPGQCFWICLALPFMTGLELQVIGNAPEDEGGELFSVEGISKIFKEKAEKGDQAK